MTLTGTTRLAGVIGHPITHTVSPAMHNAAYAHLGLDCAYIPLHVLPEALEAAIKGLRAFEFLGANVTLPYKEAVIPYLDELDMSAQKAQAVNTIVNQDGWLIGYNTDGAGFVYSVQNEAHFSLKKKCVLILGAGGAAKGIAHRLLQEGIYALTLLNRSHERAEHLAKALSGSATLIKVATHHDPLAELLAQADLVINTTPLGMTPDLDASPLSAYEGLSNATLCCDIIYKPAETLFLKKAKEKGASILGGAGMLAGQGMLAFELMTGKSIPFDIMRAQL